MRIAMVVNGTRGDVQPAVVLAHALARRGHEVRIGLPPNTMHLVEELAPDTRTPDPRALDVRRLGLDTRAHLEAVARGRERAGRNPVRRLRVLAGLRDIGWHQLVGDMAQVVDGADVIVTGLVTEQPAAAFAEAAGVPLVSVHHAPVRRNGHVGPLPGQLPGSSGVAVRAQWLLVDAAFGMVSRAREARLRAELGLPTVSTPYAARLRALPGVELQAYDPLFGVGGDRRWDADSVSRRRPCVGFLGVMARERSGTREGGATSGLAEWLDAGEAPIYIGFGSMPLRRPERALAAFAEVGRRLGRRVLVCAGWNDVPSVAGGAALSDDLRMEAHVDHGTVLARCALAVHHGGAGTTAAALRAGTPSVICWYGSDQPFWGAQLTRLRVGLAMPMTAAARDFDVDRIVAAAGAMLAPDVADRARRVGDALIGHDAAVEHAVREIERQVTSSTGGESAVGESSPQTSSHPRVPARPEVKVDV
ncbi:glycosyltransferase [Gordonia terrae]|uniref:glycosyltransferase n=1 Tax=Gordonia terrae TaxID=2055 RepID=UPI003F6B10A9